MKNAWIILFVAVVTVGFSQSETVSVVVDYDFGTQMNGTLTLHWCKADGDANSLLLNVGNRGQCIEKTEDFGYGEMKLELFVDSFRLPPMTRNETYQVCIIAEDLLGYSGVYITCDTLRNLKDSRISLPNDTFQAWRPEPNPLPMCLLGALSQIQPGQNLLNALSSTENARGVDESAQGSRIDELLSILEGENGEESNIDEPLSSLQGENGKDSVIDKLLSGLQGEGGEVNLINQLLSSLEQAKLIDETCRQQVEQLTDLTQKAGDIIGKIGKTTSR